MYSYRTRTVLFERSRDQTETMFSFYKLSLSANRGLEMTPEMLLFFRQPLIVYLNSICVPQSAIVTVGNTWRVVFAIVMIDP